MVPRENKNNAYAKFGGPNKEYYGISEVSYYCFVLQHGHLVTWMQTKNNSPVAKKKLKSIFRFVWNFIDLVWSHRQNLWYDLRWRQNNVDLTERQTNLNKLYITVWKHQLLCQMPWPLSGHRFSYKLDVFCFDERHNDKFHFNKKKKYFSRYLWWLLNLNTH